MKIKFSPYTRKFKMEQLQSHIWLTASSYMGKYLRISSYTVLESPSSYITLQLLHSEFSYLWGKFSFLFYQCRPWVYAQVSCSVMFCDVFFFALSLSKALHPKVPGRDVNHIDKKENQIFLKYKEIQNGAVAKSYMTNSLFIHIWGNMYLRIS